MKSFTQHNTDPPFEFSLLQFILCFLISLLVGVILGLTLKWYIGLAVGLGLLLIQYVLLGKWGSGSFALKWDELCSHVL